MDECARGRWRRMQAWSWRRCDLHKIMFPPSRPLSAACPIHIRGRLDWPSLDSPVPLPFHPWLTRWSCGSNRFNPCLGIVIVLVFVSFVGLVCSRARVMVVVAMHK